MKPLQTTDKIKVTDGDTLLWYNFKNGKGVYEVDYTLARDVVSNGEIFFYKRNAMWQKSNLNKNNRVSCPYGGENYYTDQENKINHLIGHNTVLKTSIGHLEKHITELTEMLEKSNKEKQEWKQMAHTLADALEGSKKCSDKTTAAMRSRKKAQNALEQFKKMQ